MNKEEFLQSINDLVKKSNDIPFDDYYGAIKVINEFESFVDKHSDYLNQYVLEDIGIIKSFFEDMKKSKKQNDKIKYWGKGSAELKVAIESMLSENQFPDTDEAS